MFPEPTDSFRQSLTRSWLLHLQDRPKPNVASDDRVRCCPGVIGLLERDTDGLPFPIEQLPDLARKRRERPISGVDDVACPEAVGRVLECSDDGSPNPFDCDCMENLLSPVGEFQFVDAVADSLDEVALTRVGIRAVDRSRTQDREAGRLPERRFHGNVVVLGGSARIGLVAELCVLVERERLRRERNDPASVGHTGVYAMLVDVHRAHSNQLDGSAAARAGAQRVAHFRRRRGGKGVDQNFGRPALDQAAFSEQRIPRTVQMLRVRNGGMFVCTRMRYDDVMTCGKEQRNRHRPHVMGPAEEGDTHAASVLSSQSAGVVRATFVRMQP
jgi:hypothetical protein